MGRVFGVTAKTIERWESRRGLPTNDPVRIERLVAAQQITELGTAVYTPEGFAQFLQLPMRVFQGQSALQLMERGEMETVMGALASDYEGVGY
jgi:hypothetical protein